MEAAISEVVWEASKEMAEEEGMALAMVVAARLEAVVVEERALGAVEAVGGSTGTSVAVATE